MRGIGRADRERARGARARHRAHERIRAIACRSSFPAASSSASRLPARSSSSPISCCSTSRLSALDLKLREEMRDEIHRIVRELSITTVFVTHDQGEALVLSDLVAVMNDGVIEQLDTPQADLSHARDRASSPISSAVPMCSPAAQCRRTPALFDTDAGIALPIARDGADRRPSRSGRKTSMLVGRDRRRCGTSAPSSSARASSAVVIEYTRRDGERPSI